MAKHLSILAGLALLAACGSGNDQEAATEEAATEATAASEPDAVVVYAAYEDKTYLPKLFNEFTQATGLIVIVRNGEPAEIVEDVIESRADPLADVLITGSAADMWRVAEEGELRPNYSERVTANVPAWLRDPDKYWHALGYREAEIVFNPEQLDGAIVSEDLTYEDLADESFRRKLCLSSSAIAINRSVIAMLMQKLGRREAELAVSGWVANLALPPFETEAQLVQALARGECAIGIAASGATAGTRLQVQVPTEAYLDIEAVGVTRHARNPDGAMALVDWLADANVQRRHAEQTGLRAIPTASEGGNAVIQVAAGALEATKLAERARYR